MIAEIQATADITGPHKAAVRGESSTPELKKQFLFDLLEISSETSRGPLGVTVLAEIGDN